MYREVVKLLVQCMIVFLVAITLSSCGQGEDVSSTGADDMPRKAAVDSSKVEKMLAGADGQLTYRNEYLYYDYENDDRVSYLNYDNILLKEGQEPQTTGIHANITPDGKIDWAKEGRQKFYKEEEAKEMKMEELISLNDKPFRLPCKFEDLNDKYVIFDRVDFSTINEENLFPFTITDKVTGTSISALSKSDFGETYLGIFDKKLGPLLEVYVDNANGEIVGISTIRSHFSKLDIDVGSVKIGNTLNEMYEKLGAPWTHERNLKFTSYLFKQDDLQYYVDFGCRGVIYDGSNRFNTKSKNVITEISAHLILRREGNE